MNFYAFNIGDYAGATRHLSWDEDMAYRRMLDAYYSREAPLPLDPRQIYRLVGASDERQREAVNVVLGEFFEQAADGWHNNRADEEIAKTQLKKQKAQQSAAMRWQGGPHTDRNANASGKHANASKNNATAMPTQSEGNAPNPNPNPSKDSYPLVARARDPDATLEHTLRRAAGWETHPNPKLAITGPIQALLDNGADLELDVLPTIKAIAGQCETPSWNFFVKAIARSRDRRLEAATVITMPTPAERKPAHGTPRLKPTRTETFDRIYAALGASEAIEGEVYRSDEGPRDPDEGQA